MSGKTIWREGNRIRETGGSGYGDIVTDDEIRGHLADPSKGVRWQGYEEFAQAVLAIRAFERATTTPEQSTTTAAPVAAEEAP
jgi:hypothetical protein